MTYYDDSNGWLSDRDTGREAIAIEPPAHGEKIVGQPYPNWTGVAWVMVPCAEPASYAPPSIYAIDLSLTCPTPQQAINTDFDVTAILTVHGDAQVAPISDTFAVPILNTAGVVIMVKAITFTNGIAHVAINFAKSGYYTITNEGINTKLPDGAKIFLKQSFELVAFE